MERSFLKKFGVLILAAALAVLVLALVTDEVTPKASVSLRFSRDEIMDRARGYLTGLGYNLKDYQQDAWLGFETQTHVFLQGRNGMGGANRLIRSEMIPAHHWYVVWYDRNASRSQNPETFRVWMTPAGSVLGYEHVISDSVRRTSISYDAALQLAVGSMKRQGVDLAGYTLSYSTETQHAGRKDYFFTWSEGDTTSEQTVWARVQGDEVGGFRRAFRPGGAFQRVFSEAATTWTFVGTAAGASTFLLFFFIVTLFLKKYHEGEVGVKTGLMVFAGLFAVSFLQTLNAYPSVGTGTQIGDLNQFNGRIIIFAISVFILHVFLAVMVFAAWSVGESSSRLTWPEKLTAVDSALFRKFFTANIAEGILRGYMGGLVMLGLYALLVYVVTHHLGARIVILGIGGAADSFRPGLQPFLTGIVLAVFAEIVYRLFFLSYLIEKTKRRWLAVSVSTAIWMVSGYTFWDIPFGALSLPMSAVAMVLFGLAFSWLFLRYDLLTAISANFIISAVNAAIPLYTSTGSYFHGAQWLAAIVLALPLVIAAIGFMRRERFEFTPSTTPEHIKRISERERMAKELEIARNVQMSLLPKANPVLRGYDVAGVCIPALEVGGDYYDFVSLGGAKVGIAIGDVSGKGVPAAIYMTLTKGILQSNAEENTSPKRVLTKVNNLMYRTIERNSFVSMFYAVLDTKRRSMRFARAGQCPVILSQHAGRKGTFLSPRGLALGLEEGKVFDRVIEEQEIRLKQGEVLVFYTDGFTEAMDGRGDEFGARRLVEAVARHRAKGAGELIAEVCKEVAAFTGDRPQHDDMTMVVLKVTEPGGRNRVDERPS